MGINSNSSSKSRHQNVSRHSSEDQRRSRRNGVKESPSKKMEPDDQTLTTQLRRLRKRNGNHLDDKKDDLPSSSPSTDSPPEMKKSDPVSPTRSEGSSDDLISPEKRPPVKLTVKFNKEGRKPCQVHVVNSSFPSTTAIKSEEPEKTEIGPPMMRASIKGKGSSTLENVLSSLSEGGNEDGMIKEIKMEFPPSDDAEVKPLSSDLCARDLVKSIEQLGHNDGEISTSLLSADGEELKTNALEPPKIPQIVLTKDELSPPTPCVFVNTKAEAFSPQLFELCLQRSIVVIRNLAPICDIDMSLYGTKSLVESHPNHAVEIRTQVEQSADENLDPSLEKQVWYCTSSRSHTTISKYAEYQAAGLEDAYQEALIEAGGNAKDIDFKKFINPPERSYDSVTERKMLKFGTNCDLSDPHKWGKQLSELDKLPAWIRVVSAGNMLSHLGHQILGMNTVQLYMKVPRARTPGHQENNNFCAVNLNVGPGDSEWFGVPNDYWGGLQSICKKNKVDFLHGSWWPNVKELQDAGIPVYRFMQKPGDLVWVNTGCVHWVQAAGWCNNIAWNVGPMTSHQYKVAIERYEWNKTQKYQSIVAMVFLSWNLARNICLSNTELYHRIRHSLMHSLRQSIQTINFVRSKGVRVRFHGHRSHESAHYCGICDEEVFNVLLIKESEKRHVVHCLRCARQPNTGGKDLKGIIALVEYPLMDLLHVYDNFKLVKPEVVSSTKSRVKSEPASAIVSGVA